MGMDSHGIYFFFLFYFTGLFVGWRSNGNGCDGDAMRWEIFFFFLLLYFLHGQGYLLTTVMDFSFPIFFFLFFHPPSLTSKRGIYIYRLFSFFLYFFPYPLLACSALLLLFTCLFLLLAFGVIYYFITLLFSCVCIQESMG